MNTLKRLVWLLIGVGVGITLSAATGVRAQQVKEQSQNTVSIHYVREGYGLFFMSDDKTHSCWVGSLESGTNAIAALAPAPAKACQ